MAQNPSSDTSDVKTLFRALEDRRDSRIQMKITKEYMMRDLAACKDKVSVEMNYNNHLKQKLEQLNVMNQKEKEKLETISSLRSMLAKGNLNKVVCFALDSVQKYKVTTNAKQNDFEKKLNQHIEDYTKKRPLVARCQQKEAHFAHLQQQLKFLREEKIVFAERAKKDKQINGLLFEQNVVEMAQHVLKYYSLVDKLKHPNKTTQRAAPLIPMLKATTPKQIREQPSEPMQESTDQDMTESSAISKDQQTFDSNGDDELQNFDLNSAERGGMRQKKSNEKKDQPRDQRHKEVVNKEQPKMPMVPKSQSILNKQNTKEGSQENEKHNSEPVKYAKHPTPSTSSLKVPAEGSQKSEKSRKAKVTFVDQNLSSSSSPSFQMDAFGDEGFSSFKNTEMAAFSEDENDIPMNNDNEEDDIQMNDGEKTAEQERLRTAANKSPSFVEEMDDDQISNWTSLEIPAANTEDGNKKANSPQSKASSFDFDFNDQFAKNSNNSKPANKDSFFNFDMDMDDFFK